MCIHLTRPDHHIAFLLGPQWVKGSTFGRLNRLNTSVCRRSRGFSSRSCVPRLWTLCLLGCRRRTAAHAAGSCCAPKVLRVGQQGPASRAMTGFADLPQEVLCHLPLGLRDWLAVARCSRCACARPSRNQACTRQTWQAAREGTLPVGTRASLALILTTAFALMRPAGASTRLWRGCWPAALRSMWTCHSCQRAWPARRWRGWVRRTRRAHRSLVAAGLALGRHLPKRIPQSSLAHAAPGRAARAWLRWRPGAAHKPPARPGGTAAAVCGAAPVAPGAPRPGCPAVLRRAGRPGGSVPRPHVARPHGGPGAIPPPSPRGRTRAKLCAMLPAAPAFHVSWPASADHAVPARGLARCCRPSPPASPPATPWRCWCCRG